MSDVNYTLGEVLKSARQNKKLTVEQVELDTKIRSKYIRALEEGTYQDLPADIYTRRILQTYADFLMLDYFGILKLYRKEGNIQGKSPIEEKYHLNLTSIKSFIVTHKLISSIIFMLSIFAIATYFYMNLQSLNEPPHLTINSPANNITTNISSVDIIGNTDINTTILINGQKIHAKEDGSFNEKYTLKDGENDISIKAISKYNGKETLIQRFITYKPDFNIFLSLEVLDTTFVEVESDGQVALNKSLESGETYDFKANKLILIKSHNAKNTIVEIEGEKNSLGENDEYIEKEFNVSNTKLPLQNPITQ